MRDSKVLFSEKVGALILSSNLWLAESVYKKPQQTTTKEKYNDKPVCILRGNCFYVHCKCWKIKIEIKEKEKGIKALFLCSLT